MKILNGNQCHRMNAPQKIIFEPIQQHEDYIEYRVSYLIGEDKWVVDGIGWVTENGATYYLRSLELNNRQVASPPHQQKALLVEQDSSLKFNHQALEDFTLVNIHQKLLGRR